MSKAIFLACILAVCASADALHCPSTCAFYFCNSKSELGAEYEDKVDSNVEVGRSNSDKILTSTICREGDGTVGEAYAWEASRVQDGGPKLISEIGYGIRSDFFKIYLDSGHTRSGVGHQDAQEYSKDQLMVFDNKCWVLPIRAYQLHKGLLVETKLSTFHDDDLNCISFSTTVADSSPTEVDEYSEYNPPPARRVDPTPAAHYTPAAPVATPVSAPAYTPTAPVYADAPISKKAADDKTRADKRASEYSKDYNSKRDHYKGTWYKKDSK